MALETEMTKNTFASVTIQGLLVLLAPLLSEWFRWYELTPESKGLLIAGSLGWLWSIYGRMRQGDLTLGKGAKIAAPIFLAVVGLMLSGCALVSPPKEDIAAVRAAGERLPQLIDSSENVYRTAIKGLVAELRTRAHGEVAQATDYEILKVTSARDSAGALVPVTPETLAEIVATRARLDAEAERAISAIEAASLDHSSHEALREIAGLLSSYILTRATDDEQRQELATRAHDLIYKKKEVK